MHGNDGEVSKMELDQISTLIQKIYTEAKMTPILEHKWLFELPMGERLAEGYQLQIAWVDGVRKYIQN